MAAQVAQQVAVLARAVSPGTFLPSRAVQVAAPLEHLALVALGATGTLARAVVAAVRALRSGQAGVGVMA
jgi:hypothetical protein